jgi:RimJ/RimL family protein N-acetyltransferase
LAGESIGICSLDAIDSRSRTATLGIWIGRDHWDHGYGTDATRVVCSFGFRHLNLQRIELLVFEPNERGRRVYERVGFRHEGTLRRAHFVGGRHVDVLVMGLLDDELEA